MFLKIKYIIQGYFNLFISKFKELKNHKLYDERYKICSVCKFNNKEICSVCGCLIKAKTKSDSKCPKQLWKN